MAERIPRWVTISGIGCGALVVVAIAIAAGGFFYVRDAIRGFEAADATIEAAAERFGPISGFRPEADGRIPPERLDAFLVARDRCAPWREEAERSLEALSVEGRPGTGLRKAWAGATLLHRLAAFLRHRSEALQETGMGPGEYYYLYTLAFYSGLGKSPADGPAFKLVGGDGYVLENLESLEESAVRDGRAEMARRSLNRVLLPVLRNQLADLASSEINGDAVGWEQTLAAEIAALEADDRRLPWEEGLPAPIDASLRPHLARLEASYSPMCNALEIGIARR